MRKSFTIDLESANRWYVSMMRGALDVAMTGRWAAAEEMRLKAAGAVEFLHAQGLQGVDVPEFGRGSDHEKASRAFDAAISAYHAALTEPKRNRKTARAQIKRRSR